MAPFSAEPIGRFAPTPSGPLHFGSLVTAVASYCHARSHNGQWLIRIEDVDTPRVVAGSADQILHSLEAFGFEWDGPVLYQSQRFEAYQLALQKLLDNGYLYACQCSRKQLRREAPQQGPLGMIYPGHCRDKKLQADGNSLRLNLQAAGNIGFTDDVFGWQQLDLAGQVGDLVMKRRDQIFAYHLAVVIDDAFQQVDQIVRGADLLMSTPVHLYLNQLLGYQPARYLHLPLAKNPNGDKLSKQTGATALDPDQAAATLCSALQFLGQDTTPELAQATPAEILAEAVRQWKPARIPAHY